jgi:hypothetical protein
MSLLLICFRARALQDPHRSQPQQSGFRLDQRCLCFGSGKEATATMSVRLRAPSRDGNQGIQACVSSAPCHVFRCTLQFKALAVRKLPNLGLLLQHNTWLLLAASSEPPRGSRLRCPPLFTPARCPGYCQTDQAAAVLLCFLLLLAAYL